MSAPEQFYITLPSNRPSDTVAEPQSTAAAAAYDLCEPSGDDEPSFQNRQGEFRF